MKRSKSERQSAAQWFSGAAQWLTALAASGAFLILSVISLTQTCRVEIIGAEDHEHVIFIQDSIVLNIAVLLAMIVLLVLLMRIRVERKTSGLVAIFSIVVTAAVGIWWVLSAHAGLSFDSEQIINAAKSVASGDFSPLRENLYFRRSPYQTGYMLFAEGFFRLFGTNSLPLFQILNVLFVCAGNAAVILITRELFSDARVELLTALLLGLSLQPAFLSTFLYGTIPGMAAAYWSLYFVIRFIRIKKASLLIPAAFLIAAAITLKRNYVILMIAEIVFLFFYSLRAKKPAALALIGVAAILALSYLLPAGAQKQYEARADVTLGKGMPQIAFLVMGMSPSPLCFGWYSSYNDNVIIDNNYDYEATLAACKRDLWDCFVDIWNYPYQYFYSFLSKTESQWNEPEFQCIWSSASVEPEKLGDNVAPLIASMSVGRASDAIHSFFNQLMQFVYVLMTAAFLTLLFRKRERDEARMVIPLAIFGAVIYHLFFEAKSQYAIIYIHLMMPYAAFGVKMLSDSIFRRKGEREDDPTVRA